MSTTVPTEVDRTMIAPEEEEGPTLRVALRKLVEGELGPVRVLIVLALIWVIFTIANDRFLTAVNLTNLALQTAAIGTISVGVVLVLLLGEIDLSVGAVSGVCAAVMAVLNVKHGWNPYLAMIAALVAGALIGLFQGSVATRLGIPSFVVTLALRVAAPAIAILAAVAVVNSDRGVPLSILILVGFCVLFTYVTTRTRWGRYVFAVGGNAEAARRAGINVTMIRTSVFILASTMAAAGGILAAARLLAVNQSSGGSDTLLLAIAGPVIAGVSLFGGRGSVWAALTGALVIQSISNGMDLLALQSSVKFMVTGGVLLAAVSLDAIAQQRRRAHGRL